VSHICAGLRFRLLLLVLVTCAPLVALTLHTASQARRRQVADWQHQALRLLEVARLEEEQLVGSTRQLLLAMAESSSVRSMNRHGAKSLLDEVFTSCPRFANLGVLDTNGQIVASAMPIPGAETYSNRSFFRRTMDSGAFTIGDFPTAPANGRPTLCFGCPAFDREGQLQGAVFAELDLQWFDQFGSELPSHLPKGAAWTEFDRQGTVLARYPKPESWIGQRLVQPALIEAAFGPVHTPLLETTNRQGAAEVYALGRLESPLAMRPAAGVLSIPRQLLFADSERALARNLSWLAVAVALAFILGWAGSRILILRPAAVLVRSITRLAAGDLSARTGLPHSRDEVGQLTLAFDQMAQALQQRELERQRSDQRLQVLSLRVVEAQESERRHIARELHDEIGQSLTAAEMHLQAALQSSGKLSLERRLEESIRAVEHVQEQVHDLSLNLRPSMLDDLGLEPTLRWYLQRQTEIAGLATEFRAESLGERVAPIIETECFRIAQEALTNIVRHARARSVVVRLSRREDQLHLSVRDDGIGFDVAPQRQRAVAGGSLGLLSMEERAVLAGGGLELLSAPGKGTEIRAWFPLNRLNANSLVEAHESVS
jgi:signal transduction histidine kinase